MDKQQYKELCSELVEEKIILKEQLHKSKEKIKELETELYFCHRNNKIEKGIND